MKSIEFGVFDHLDRGRLPVAEVYQNRLRLVEAYDEAGFYAYHLAEHHATTLSLAPSPGIFLSSIAQRTSRLRFGPMVYVLPLYDPLRLIEEIGMLDQLSGGRLEMGFGKGGSEFELGYFGVGNAESRSLYDEALDVVLQGLGSPVLNHRGKHFNYLDVPIVVQPLQRPHPPLWHGLTRVDGAAQAAQHGINVMMNGPASSVRPKAERFIQEWKLSHDENAVQPKIGLTRHVFVADSDEEAVRVARRSYDVW